MSAFYVEEESDFKYLDSDDLNIYFSDTYPIFDQENSEDSVNLRNRLLDAVMYAVGKKSDIVEEVLKIGQSGNGSVNNRNLESYYKYGRDSHPYGLPDLTKTIEIARFEGGISSAQIIADRFNCSPNDVIVESVSYTQGISQLLDGGPLLKAARDRLPTDILEDIWILNLQRYGGYDAYSGRINIPESAASPLNLPWGNILNSSLWEPLLPPEQRQYQGEIYPVLYNLNRDSQNLTTTVQHRFLTYNTTTGYRNISTYTKYDLSYAKIKTDYVKFVFRLKNPEDYTGDNSAGARSRVWIYAITEPVWNNGYSDPRIKIVKKREIFTPDLYPMMPMKAKRVELNENHPDQNLYNKTVSLCEKLGLNFEDMVQGLREGNSRYNDIYSAFLIVGANFNTKNKYELTYIWDYFNDPDLGGISENAIGDEIFTGNYELNFQETSYTSNPNFKKTLQMGSVSKRRGTGALTEDAIPTGFITTPGGELYAMVGEPGEVGTYRIRIDNYAYLLAKQTSSNEWEELVITDLGSKSYIVKSVWTFSKAYDILNKDNQDIILPIERDRLSSYPIQIQNEIIHRSLHIHITGLDRTSLSWYETTDFAEHLERVQIILTAVSIALTIVTFGASAASQGAINAFINSIISALIARLEAYIIAYLLTEMFEYLANEIGAEEAAVATLIVGIVISVYSNETESGFDSAAIATQALNYTSVVSGSYATLTQEEYAELQREQADYTKTAQELLDEIKQIQDGLNPGSISPFALGLLEKESIVIESPTEFFYRTMHVGNPGVLTIQNPRNFVARHLKLPDMLKDDSFSES